jgi:6-phosphofructokinase 1
MELVDNLIPRHDDSWDQTDLSYNMEISDSDGPRTRLRSDSRNIPSDTFGSAVIIQEIVQSCSAPVPKKLHCFLRAGPRSQIVFRGSETRAAVVTCGGLCPGINNVVRYGISGVGSRSCGC